MLAFLALPILALVSHAPHAALAALKSDDSRQAIFVSIRTTCASLVLIVLFGTPVAIFLGRGRFFGSGLVATFVEVPMVLPPAVAGIGLLLAFGRNGLIHTELPFTMGAVVLAQTFVAAPLYIRPLAAALQGIDPHWHDAAALDGASGFQTLRWITFPLVRVTVISGAVLAWARSLGEFGATILFAGNLAGKTQTMPLAIYLGLESDLNQAIGLSVVLLAVALIILALVRGLEQFARR